MVSYRKGVWELSISPHIFELAVSITVLILVHVYIISRLSWWKLAKMAARGRKQKACFLK
jgi:hypothetical protein